jgi:ornithine carrier protein
MCPELKGCPEKDLPYTEILYCGMFAGSITSLFLTPIELVKCTMQVPLESSSRIVLEHRIIKIIASIYRHQGVLGYWHGQFRTLVRETGGGAV